MTLLTNDIDPANVAEVSQELDRGSILWAEEFNRSQYATLHRQVVGVRLDPPAYQIQGWYCLWVRPSQIKRIVCHRLDDVMPMPPDDF